MWAHMQSVRACAVETHFSIFFHFLKTAPKSVHFGFILVTISTEHIDFVRKKKCQQKVCKRCPPKWIPRDYDTFPGLPDSTPRMCAFSTRNNSSSTNSRNCCSNYFFSKRMFHFVSIAVFLKTCSRKNGKGKEHIVGDLTRLGPRPGEFIRRTHGNI